MGVNGIYSNNISDTYVSNTSAKEKTENTQTTEQISSDASIKNDTAAVYNKSKLSEDDRKAIVEQLKADQEKRQSQLTDLVSDMMSKQANTFGTATDIWKFLAKGNFTVDAETKKKAQEDIAEDGYWGVEQTSDRIVSFATALAGDDSEALEKMRDAFKKGYDQAQKQWGGKLPDISKRTYDAVMKKFDEVQNSNKKDLEESSTEISSENTKTSSEDGSVIIKETE